jgi:hypothetical protein
VRVGDEAYANASGGAAHAQPPRPRR